VTLRLRGWRGAGQKRFGGPARHGKALPKTAICRHQRCLVLCEPQVRPTLPRLRPQGAPRSRLKEDTSTPRVARGWLLPRGEHRRLLPDGGEARKARAIATALLRAFPAAAANTYDGNATRSAKSILAVNTTGYAPHLSARIQSLLLGDGRGISHSVQAKCVRAGRAVGAADDVCRPG
jgi:hypothetical protein